MNTPDASGDRISANIKGTISGQVAVGKQISQTQRTAASGKLDAQALSILEELFQDLKVQARTQLPATTQASATERIDELHEAITAEKPDLTTMEYVKGWFAKHAPGLLSSVGSLIFHPLVSKVMESAGAALAQDFRHRFGIPD
jgi:hypothetical protein